MSNLPITHPYNAYTAQVDKHIGDAYPAVEAVAQRLQEIIYLAQHLADIQPRDIELSAASEEQELLWRRVGETDWKVLATYQELLGTDLTTANETLADAIDRIIELERTQSDFWQKTPDPYEEGVTVTSPYYCITYDGAYYSPNPDALPFFTGVFNPVQWRNLASLGGGGGGGGSLVASIVGNQAVTMISGRRFALYEVDGSNNPLVYQPQMVGPLATLLAYAGRSGQVTIASDANAVVVHSGVVGNTQVLQQINNREASQGDRSYSIGYNASTDAQARDSISLGANAISKDPGQITFGSITPGVTSFKLNVAARSTDASDVVMTLDGLPEGANNIVRFTGDGIYNVAVIVLARQIGTNNCARFKRNAVVRRAGNNTTLLFATTPEADANSNLPDLLVTLVAFSGGYLNIYVNGAVGKTIQWSAHLTVDANRIVA